MKRAVIFALGVAFLLLLSSCDLESFGKNLWVESGLVTPDTAAADAAVASVTNTALATEGEKLKVMTDSERTQVIGDILKLTSEAQTDKLVKELSNPVTSEIQAAAEATLNAALTDLNAVLNDSSSTLSDQQKEAIRNLLPEIPAGVTLTQADVLNIQLATSMAIQVQELLGNTTDPTPEQVTSVVGEALDVINIIQKTSGAARIDLLQNVDLSVLLGQSRNAGGRAAISVDTSSQEVKSFAPLASAVIKALGGGDGTVGEQEFTEYVIKQQMIRGSYEAAIAVAKKANQPLPEFTGLSGGHPETYILSVVFSELAAAESDVLASGVEIHEALTYIITDNPGLIDGTFGDELIIRDGILNSTLNDNDALIEEYKDKLIPVLQNVGSYFLPDFKDNIDDLIAEWEGQEA